jgi:hypothetical protein
MKRSILAVLLATLAAPARAQQGFIPPPAAAQLGIPAETLKRVDDLAFAANEELIGLEAGVRRAQLALDRELRSPAPDEARALDLVEAVGRAEIGVRRNRLQLLIRVRRTLGDELWQRVEAWKAQNPPPPGRQPLSPPGGAEGRPGRPPLPPGRQPLPPGRP